MRPRSSLAALFFFFAGREAQAEPRRLSYDPTIDIAVVSAGTIFLTTAEILKAKLVPKKCRWCYRRADGSSDLNVIDRKIRLAVKWDSPKTADVTSSIIAYAFMPLGALGGLVGSAAYDDALSGAPADGLVAAEATILAADLNALVKFVFARERPFAHYRTPAPEGVQALADSPNDDNLSFYSGHTTLAFAIAASSSTVAFLRGYRLAPVVLGVGAASALSVGYLRIAADKHYFSDVMVGAVLGSLIGAFVPLVFHPAHDRVTTPTAAAQPLGTANTPFMIDGVW